MWLEEFMIQCEVRDSTSHIQSTIGGDLGTFGEHTGGTQSLGRIKERPSETETAKMRPKGSVKT